jgi:hypothetical protein
MSPAKGLGEVASTFGRPLRRRRNVVVAAFVGAATGGIGLAIYFGSLRELIPIELAGGLVLAFSAVFGVDLAHLASIVMPILGALYGYLRAEGSNRQLANVAHATPLSRPVE